MNSTIGPTDSPSTTGAVPDLVVLSHLRWQYVWQRPQHLISRLTALRAGTGSRTFFVEEPVPAEVSQTRLRTEAVDGVTRVWLEVPRTAEHGVTIDFGSDSAEGYAELIADLIGRGGAATAPDVWLYTPMAFDIAQVLEPGRFIYDVMDDLASFKDAPAGLRLRQLRALAEADVVFSGGRSLHKSVVQHRTEKCYLFPSGVDTAHYAASRALRTPRSRKVAGYVGVIDERLDLDLIAGLAQALPDWTLRIVGPVAKIDPASLPQSPNIEYPGMTSYCDLPTVMASFDVALMPFALNEATRSISPTKTLEYLAAGLPVVSTRIPDVLSDYTGVVHFADDADEFAAACLEVVEHEPSDRDRRLQPIQARQEWDFIARRMHALLNAAKDRRLSRVAAQDVTA